MDQEVDDFTIAETTTCSSCGEPGVAKNYSMATEMYCTPFKDSNGVKHFHDRNNTSTTYKCPKCGKNTVKVTYNKCNACQWTSKSK